MRIFLETIAAAFGMFSAVPVPQPVWNKNNMRYMMCAFPLVGVLTGLLIIGWGLLAVRLGMTDILRGAGFCLIPIAVSGGVHLDGYADTSDALSSYGSREKKLEILSDPHCGAFAVIRLAVHLIASLALCVSLNPEPGALLCLALSFPLSRALSGWAITSFPMAKDTGLAHTFASGADRKRVRRVLLIIIIVLCAALLAAGRPAGPVMILAAVLALLRYHHVAGKEFGGITGDLAGWFLQKAELWMLAALIAVQLAEGLL